MQAEAGSAVPAQAGWNTTVWRQVTLYFHYAFFNVCRHLHLRTAKP